MVFLFLRSTSSDLLVTGKMCQIELLLGSFKANCFVQFVCNKLFNEHYIFDTSNLACIKGYVYENIRAGRIALSLF